MTKPLIANTTSWWQRSRMLAMTAMVGVHLGLLGARYTAIVPAAMAELTRYLPYYWLLVLGVMALVLSIRLPFAWFFLGVANLLLLATVTMGLVWGSPGGDVPAGTKVRVLTYNVKAFYAVRHPGGLEALAAEIRRFQPDIVALQDADSWVVARSESAVVPVPPMFGLPHVVAMGQYILASRYPLNGCEPGHIDIPDESHRYLRCKVQIAGKEVQLVTAHFVSPRAALSATRRYPRSGFRSWEGDFSDRLTQARTLASDLSVLRRPMIVMGDLNAPEGSMVVEALKSVGMQDAFSMAGQGYGFTHGHSLARGLNFLRIDHVLVSPDIAAVHSEVGGREASEHNPVIADLVLLP